MSLENEIALVTGASRGIGKAIAIELGSMGATVIGTATSQSGADNITNYLNDSDIKGKGLCLEVTNQESISKTLSAMTDEYGAPSILV